MGLMNFIAAFFALVVSIMNLVGIYKVNKWIEKNGMSSE